MRARLIVFANPNIEIGLQVVNRAIDFFAERHPVELVECSLVEALADAVGLWALGLIPIFIEFDSLMEGIASRLGL